MSNKENGKDKAKNGAHKSKKSKSGGQAAGTFVKKATIADMYEIEAARVALGRSHNESVRHAAWQMLHDHTTDAHQMRSALRMNETRDVEAPPEEMDSRHKNLVKKLQEASEDEFDETYLEQQVKSHKETLDLMEGYRDGGDNPQLCSLAAGAAPVVKRHLERVKELKSAMG